ncbi:MAG: response regulator transcription factor [Archangium sp.]|nr:response regulator transcription factor [Archangium sp.]MDP3154465.1 response regulator transcription factor [Archangium sp.]MDP3572930.1 response regulator transcription factor [Archangium sp.]
MNILLVDDHQMMRDGLRAVLERESDLHVSGEAADGRTALELCSTLHPDVVVMDIGMPGLNGIEATRQVTTHHPRTRVVALSMNADRRYVHAMFEAGAWAYLVKSSASDELIRAIRAVSHDEKYVSPTVASAVLDAFVVGPKATQRDPRSELSPREREVLQLLAEGMTSKEIAGKLDLAVSTIETHRKQIMAKLELRSVAELTKFAIRTGITTLE